jgi:hypothetical protein
MTFCHNDTQHKCSVVKLAFIYAECHYAKCHYAECHDTVILYFNLARSLTLAHSSLWFHSKVLTKVLALASSNSDLHFSF